MSQPVLIKAYGHLSPAGANLANSLEEIFCQAIPKENGLVELDKNLCRISFEGIWFPADEILACIKGYLTPEISGKFDIIDLENWNLTRNIFEHCEIITKTSPLNNVLDYSGF